MLILNESEIRGMSPDKQIQVWRQTAAYYQQLVTRLFSDPEFYACMREEMSNQQQTGYLQ